jgi:Phage minor capsid protein 2.
MRSANRLEAMPHEIVRLMSRLQEWTIGDIIRRIKDTGVITSSAERQMTYIAQQNLLEADLRKQIQKTLGLTDKQIEELYNETARANYIYDKRLFDSTGINPLPFEQNAFLQNLVGNITAQTKGNLINITRSLGFAKLVDGRMTYDSVGRFYQNTLDNAVMQVTSGVSSFEQVLKQAVDKLAASGLRTIDYASGWSNRVDVATRRAVMGGLRDLTNRQSEYNAEELGTTCYEISWHSGHRPSHSWGGRRYDITGEHYPAPEELYAQHGGGTPQDFNCYHEVYACFPDTDPNYTNKELGEMERAEKETTTFEDKEYTKYEAKQMQRKMESSMRTTRLKAHGYEAAGLEDDLQVAKAKYQSQRQAYAKFSKAMGLQTEHERIYVDGLKN